MTFMTASLAQTRGRLAPAGLLHDADDRIANHFRVAPFGYTVTDERELPALDELVSQAPQLLFDCAALPVLLAEPDAVLLDYLLAAAIRSNPERIAEQRRPPHIHPTNLAIDPVHDA